MFSYIKKFVNFYYTCLNGCIHVCEHHLCAWYPWRTKEGIISPTTRASERVRLWWEPKLDPLQEQCAPVITELP